MQSKLFMLTEDGARALGFKKQFNHKIKFPTFVAETPLWVKSKAPEQIPQMIVSKKHFFSYCKKGRTFGMETKRFIEYCDGILLYFEEEDDKEYKGYCMTENLYMYCLNIGAQLLLHLTNGNQCSQFYFSDKAFFNHFQSKLLKDVVQLNFNQKYSMLELLGKGTYSKVYLASNKKTGIKYAIKMVAKKDKNGVCTKGIVVEEKKIFRVIDCEFICRMEEFFEEDEVYIFVLEFLPGKDLMTIFRENVNISLPVLVSIFRGILESLAYIHAHNIMHRDLKPQNIMIDLDTMKPKLIDFGLSLLYGPKTDLKKFKRCGTMGYMAYEVIKNSSEKKKGYDCKCDMFSFGIIAHMMLLGYNPLKGKSYNETVKNNQDMNIKLDKKSIIQKYGQEGFQFLVGLLQKDPTQRLSAQEALKTQFMTQEFLENSMVLNQEINAEEKVEDEAQFENEEEVVKIPPFQVFLPKEINLESRSN